MLIAKKVIAANMVIGGAVLAAAGKAALKYALFDPDAREKLKECAENFVIPRKSVSPVF